MCTSLRPLLKSVYGRAIMMAWLPDVRRYLLLTYRLWPGCRRAASLKRHSLRSSVLRWILGKCPLLSKMSGHLSKMDGHLSKRSGADTKRSGCHICSRHAYPADKCPIPHSPRERRVRQTSAQIVQSKRRLASLFRSYAAPR